MTEITSQVEIDEEIDIAIVIGQAHLNCIHQACLFISSMFVPENNLIHYKKRETTSYCLLYFVVHIVFSMD